jgi:membrane fusion protein
MSQTLFRPEAMQAGQASWLGGIRIGHNPKFSTVAAVALVLAGGLLAFAVWGQVARKARIPGVLVPEQGALQLGAQAPGVLVDLRVQDGERVAAGQTLFVLDTDSPTAESSTAVLLAVQITQRSTLESKRTARLQQARIRGAGP